MKKAGIVTGFIIVLILFALACDKFRNDHPQAETGGLEKVTITEETIRHYADSINRVLPSLEKQESLIYTKGDYSFRIIKYMNNGKPVLYIEKGSGGEYSRSEGRYYIKNEKLLLWSEDVESYNVPTPHAVKNIYFRNNIPFYGEYKKAVSEEELRNTPFTPVGSDESNRNRYTDLALMEDALNQRGRFNLVFERITEYPKARYLVLSKKELNAYRAVIRVEKEDELIHELVTNPISYSGSKLEIEWRVANDNEAFYRTGRLKRN